MSRRILWSLLLVPSMLGCESPQAGHEAAPAARDRKPLRSAPTIRVCLLERAAGFEVTLDTPFQLRSPGGAAILEEKGGVAYRAVVSSTANPGSVVWNGNALPPGPIEIVIPSAATATVAWMEGASENAVARRYPGVLRIVPERGGRMTLVNEVDLDQYIRGVLPAELYPDWTDETYRTQAIAARTYAIWEKITNGKDSPWDVGATESSQVYKGLASGAVDDKALRAVQYTRGIVCAWDSPAGERIFCTYFSSACGGVTQNVTNLKPVVSIPPLSGGVPCDYCRIAAGEAYRWKPRALTKEQLTTTLAAVYPAIATLGRVEKINAIESTQDGRLLRVELVGRNGKTVALRAEDFRIALGSHFMRSTHCQISADRDSITFNEGHGFGHGVGMCQWGAEGQARLGRKAGEILRYYYPTSKLARAYE